MTGPDRLWLNMNHADQQRPAASFVTKGPLAGPPYTQYVRADVVTELIKDAFVGCSKIARKFDGGEEPADETSRTALLINAKIIEAMRIALSEWGEGRATAILANRISNLNAEALGEIKATVDGESNQPIKDIIYGLLAEIEALTKGEKANDSA